MGEGVAQTLLVVGGGRMGTALVRGLLASGFSAPSLFVVESDPAKRSKLSGELAPVQVLDEPVQAEGAIVAVKPSDGEVACRSLSLKRVGRVLSIMAGIPTSSLQAWLGEGCAVVRCMPNTPALVGRGVSAICGAPSAGEGDLQWAETILGSVGVVHRVGENDLDAVTAVSGSGPAYLYLFVEALVDAGIRAGLAPELSRALAAGTFVGSARLLEESGNDPRELRAQVTSPGGTTEAAIAVLERSALRDVVAEAVAAAAERSSELGAEQGFAAT